MKNSLLLLSVLFLLGCQSAVNRAVRETKYSAYEVIGVEKRDLLKKYVKNSKESQEETQESFEDALDKLKKTYSFDGGDLERQYRALQSSYDDAEEQAGEVRADIKKVETTAADLFKEWQSEIEEIKTAALRKRSQANLETTKKQFSQLAAALKKSEQKIDPVLSKLKDHTLFIKHNLNAKAIGSLKNEAGRIEADIAALIQSMETSIKESDEFIKKIQ